MNEKEFWKAIMVHMKDNNTANDVLEGFEEEADDFNLDE